MSSNIESFHQYFIQDLIYICLLLLRR